MSETMVDEEDGWAEVLRLREENDRLIAAVCPWCITELQRQESHDAIDVLEVENQRLRRVAEAARAFADAYRDEPLGRVTVSRCSALTITLAALKSDSTS